MGSEEEEDLEVEEEEERQEGGARELVDSYGEVMWGEGEFSDSELGGAEHNVLGAVVYEIRDCVRKCIVEWEVTKDYTFRRFSRINILMFKFMKI